MLCPIALYNQTKNWEDPLRSFGEKAKQVKKQLSSQNKNFWPASNCFSGKKVVLFSPHKSILFTTRLPSLQACPCFWVVNCNCSTK